MKSFVRIVVGIALVAALGVAAFLHFTRGMTDVVQAFFEAVRRNDPVAAHELLSQDFKANTSADELSAFLLASGLTKVVSAAFPERRVDTARGVLRGAVTTSTGATIPLEITLVKEADAWRIQAITKGDAGVRAAVAATPAALSAPFGKEPPPRTEQVRLAKQALHDFGVAVNAGDMTHFRDTASGVWRRQLAREDFESAFGAAYGMGIDFTDVAAMTPEVLPAKALGANGELVVVALFPTEPSALRVEPTFVAEDGAWKLSGFDLRTE